MRRLAKMAVRVGWEDKLESSIAESGDRGEEGISGQP